MNTELHDHKKLRIRLSIKTKVLLILLMISSALLAVSFLSSRNSLVVLGRVFEKTQSALHEYIIKDSKQVLHDQGKKQLLQIARDQAFISHSCFKQVEVSVNILTQVARGIWNHSELDLAERRSFSMFERPDDITLHSVHYPVPLGRDMNDEQKLDIKRSRYLEDIFVSMRNNNSNLGSVYIVTQSGTGRVLPWVPAPDNAEQYDPRQRPWYKSARAAGALIWTSPYFDVDTRQVTITCAKPFFSQQGNFLGVIGIDLRLNRLIDNILATQIGNVGYAFLLDESGAIIAHPQYPLHEGSWEKNVERPNLLKSPNTALGTITRKMVAQKIGFDDFKDADGHRQFIAYAPLKTTRWSLGVVMPEQYVMAVALTLEQRLKDEVSKTNQKMKQQETKVQYTMGVLFIIMIFVVSGLTYWISNRITKPVLALYQGARRVGTGDLDYRINIKTGDELEELAHAFNSMTSDLKEYIQNLAETTATKKKIETELQIGRDIQASLLPEKIVQVPGWEIEAYFSPARQVAGDFYDVFTLEDSGKIFFVNADVCDKGVGPAMFAAIIRTLLRAFSRNYTPNHDSECDISELPLARINDFVFATQGDTNMFATIFAGVLDPDTGVIRYINGGHEPPLVLDADHNIKTQLKRTGPVLGAMPDMQFNIEEIILGPGESLFTYTDGLSDANDENGNFFTKTRLHERLQQPSSSAAEMLNGVITAVQGHIGNAEQFDDITVVVIRNAGNSSEKNDLK
jgi:sigma-B regulation protein RsbU (phosphoserine phosphatase)